MQWNVLVESLTVFFLILNFLPPASLRSEYLSSNLLLASKGKVIQESFVSIQQAIDQATDGSTVYVPSGTYFEQIVVNKTISLVGENFTNTIIDGSNLGTVVTITADNVTVTGFTIRNSGWGWYRNGVYVYQAGECTIEDNFLSNNCHNIRLNCSWNSIVRENRIDGAGYGIRLINSVNCTAVGNNVSNCIGGVHLQNATNCAVEGNLFTQNDQGIRMYSPCLSNKFYENIVYNNTYDGMIEAMPGDTTFLDNKIFHNNFIENERQFIYKASGNIWDDGYPSGGNYWSRYNGTDMFRGVSQNETGSDGIGDISYSVNDWEADMYPLMHPWSPNSVHNINTGIGYDQIQEAIDSPDTMDDHTLWVDSGVYQENVNVHKLLTLIGENRLTTIIDGNNVGKVLSISKDNVTLSGFTVRNSGSNYPPYGDDCGIFLDRTTGCKISDCLVTHNRIGVYVYFSDTNMIQYNEVKSNRKNGIWLWYSGNNVLERNKISDNSFNFGVSGGSYFHFNNQIDESNTVDGKPIHYKIGIRDETIDNKTDIGVLYLINCFNITVQNLNLMNNRHGLFCYNLTRSTIKRLRTLDNSYGIYLQDSNRNAIEDNDCMKNWVGIQLYYSSNNTVQDNKAGANEKGVSLYEADRNRLVENDISNCMYGMRFYSSNLNMIFHNNLIDNTHQADLITSNQNTWDNRLEGNFWNDYSGADNDRDGIGDTSYVVANDSLTDRDHHPLLGRFDNFNIHYQEISHSLSVFTNSTILSFNFEESNNTIKLRINGTDGTYGFCRVSIPHIIMEPEIIVIIDDGLTEILHPNYSIHDDGSRRWIYFAYQHSTHEIMIVPEFGMTILFLISIFLTLWIPLLKHLTRI